RFQGADTIHQGASGTRASGPGIEELALERRHLRDRGLLLSPAGVGSPAEHTEPGAGRVHEDAVELASKRRMGSIGADDIDRGKPKSVDQVLPQRSCATEMTL